MNQIITNHQKEFEATLEHLKTDLNSIRGNRAHPSLVEEIKIDVYGSEMRVKEIASITIPEPRVVVVQPWDKSVLKDLERVLAKADLNVGLQNDGAVLRLTLPPLTEESRQQILKVLGQKLEAGRVQLRQIREKIREAIVKAERENEITEDDRYKAQEDLDTFVGKYLEEIKTVGERKEAEVMTV